MKFDVPTVVMGKLFENGYEDQIIDIVMAFETDPSKEVSDIPLSPISIRNSEQHIVLSTDILEEYKKLVERIKNPETAEEIPFYLLGNNKIVNGEDVISIEKIIYSIDDNLDDLRVSLDEQKFKKLLMDSNYSIISIGHTHGNVSEEKKNNTLTELLPSDIREKYSIRDVGLNLSIADIWQHEAFKSIASQISNKKVLQTIIMYNGDFITIDDGSISKSNNVQAINQENEIGDDLGFWTTDMIYYYYIREVGGISSALLELNGNVIDIFGYPDCFKLQSSMTLFAVADPSTSVFQDVLEKFYEGKSDENTLKLLKKM